MPGRQTLLISPAKPLILFVGGPREDLNLQPSGYERRSLTGKSTKIAISAHVRWCLFTFGSGVSWSFIGRVRPACPRHQRRRSSRAGTTYREIPVLTANSGLAVRASVGGAHAIELIALRHPNLLVLLAGQPKCLGAGLGKR